MRRTVVGLNGRQACGPQRSSHSWGWSVVAHVAAVERQRVRGAVELVQVAAEQLIERRPCARVRPLGDRVDLRSRGARANRSASEPGAMISIRSRRRPVTGSVPA
jgi:hypothetical protein